MTLKENNECNGEKGIKKKSQKKGEKESEVALSEI